MPELADVFIRYGGEYRSKYGQDMLPSHRRAMDDIIHCRTERMGGHVFQCDHCGRMHYAYHSCGNRSCPKCHHQQTQVWLERRRAELLGVKYFHLVFTVPQELRPFLRARQTELYDILIKAAAQALIKLAADPHYVGGLIGVLCVLHTWSRTLNYHPHVHCLVPAGGVNKETQEWIPARTNYLVPVKALSQIFRGLFKELLSLHCADLPVPESVWRVPWVVYCEPPIAHVDKVLNYLGRYLHRIAITNHRILNIDDGRVTFGYQDSGDRQWKCMSLRAEEFIRRFLQHVLPRGFHKIRYYGMWAPANRGLLRRLQLLLVPEDGSHPVPRVELDISPEGPSPPHPMAGQKCPFCQKGLLVWSGRIPRLGRAPP